MHIFLIGFKSCGKSTTGEALADLTGRPFLDTDTEVERLFFERHGQRLGCRDIFRQCGEPFLRGLEAAALCRLTGKDDTIVATGGGIVLHDKNRDILQNAGVCVFLDVPLPTLEERLKGHASSPLFLEKGVAALHEERYPLYRAASHIHYQVAENATPEEAASEILRLTSEEYHGK